MTNHISKILAIISMECKMNLVKIRFWLIFAVVLSLTSFAGILTEGGIEDNLRLFMPQVLGYYIGIFLGLGIISEDYENKNLIFWAISRWTIILGKYLANVILYSIITCVSVFFADIVLFILSGNHYPMDLIVRSIASSGLTILIVLSMTVLISAFFLKMIPTAIASFSLFLLLILLSYVSTIPFSFAGKQYSISYIQYFSPFFYVADLGTPYPISSQDLLIYISGAIIHSIVLLLLAIVLFEKAELEDL